MKQSLNKRIEAFSKLGVLMQNLGADNPWPGYEVGLTEEEYSELNIILKTVKLRNPWFTEENVRRAFLGWGNILNESNLSNFCKDYSLSENEKNIAIIMAGNIPLVGFHDLLCVLISGNKAIVKMSSDDDVLMSKIIHLLINVYDVFRDEISVVKGKMVGFDAVIATGSNNSSRYFESYFGSYPNIIRKNRTSVAIIKNDITIDEIKALGSDIFTYFGLGCRNVTKLYFEEGFKIDRFYEGVYVYNGIINMNKYVNNYDYQRAILLMNQAQILDNGFLILKEDESIHSPIGVMYYEYFKDGIELESKLNSLSHEIQCVVGNDEGGISFGKAQSPNLEDFADGVDTMKFLISLQ